ncbi:hypothetical protein D3Z52_14810 [Clostridiaceae bacterium]|nr:hypothetical protein [Clostridiaceae bacterium]
MENAKTNHAVYYKKNPLNQYRTDHELYSVVRSQFYTYLAREGTTVKDYWTGEEYQCFFRRNKDTNQTNDNISIYYEVGNGLHPGAIITHYDKRYLILNEESVENRIYHRSDGINSDIMLTTYDKETMQEISIPVFAYDATGVIPDKSDIMSVIAGNVELMTGDNEISRRLKVNQEFYEMGNWYTIVSVNFKTGICRIEASVIQGPSKPMEYTLKISSEPTYIFGDETRMTAAATLDGSPIVNPTLLWSSSDPTVISITEDGVAICTGTGTCAIMCYWKEHDITDTVQVEVLAAPEPVYTCEISGAGTIYLGRTNTYTAKFYQTDGVTEDTTIAPVWSLDLPSELKGKVTITKQSGNTISVQVPSSSSLLGLTFKLNLTDSSGNYQTAKTVKVVSFL